MDRAAFKAIVYKIFPDKVMLAFALAAVPVTLFEIFYPNKYTSLVIAIDWLIWAIFLVEFAFKIGAENTYTAYITSNRLDAAISIIIIASGLLALAMHLFPLPVIGLLRVSRVFRALAYGDKAYIKKV